jgi:2-methylcitrate dehydratase PrpD
MQAHVDGGIMLAMQMGFNARNAVTACDMAAGGLSAPVAVLDGAFGYFRLFEGDYDLAPCLALLGKTWRITELAHKPFPSGRATHGVLDGLLTLMRRQGFGADDVDHVVCRVPTLTQNLVGRPVKDQMEVNYARLSAPYVLASALLSGGLSIGDFRPEALLEEARRALGGRITVEADGNPDKNALTPVSVTVTLKDGVRHAITIDVVYGNPAKPLTRDAHLEKFRRNRASAAPPVSREAGERLIELVDHLEDVANVSQLVDLLGRCERPR